VVGMVETRRKSVQAKMQECLDRLGVQLKVCWTPDPGHDKHGLIEPSSSTLFLFDEAEEDAWQTFLHEVFEWKLKDVTRVYRVTINGLIEIIQKLSYGEKEKFLESIPEIFKVIREVNKIEA
jgi:hypothetical protein